MAQLFNYLDRSSGRDLNGPSLAIGVEILKCGLHDAITIRWLCRTLYAMWKDLRGVPQKRATLAVRPGQCVNFTRSSFLNSRGVCGGIIAAMRRIIKTGMKKRTTKTKMQLRSRLLDKVLYASLHILSLRLPLAAKLNSY
jgi:hypothetical protein